MCLECCFPYRSLIIEEAPKKAEKKEEPKKQWFMIEPGDTMYPAAGGQQQAQVQFVPPAQQTYQSPAPMAPAAQAHPGAVPWQGATRAEIDAQNIAIAKATGATRPQSLVPYKPAEGQQWWCREVDGTYTLRTTNDIMENLQPGKWIYSSTGFPYFVREPAPA
ncbi:hypothetical protein DIZ76_013231 [Coccidioides immitis]|nr:hypothetical protein DIZ76_013231 [Coccidioides immitis]